MSYRRFHALLAMLHIVDPGRERLGHGKLMTVVYLFDHIKQIMSLDVEIYRNLNKKVLMSEWSHLKADRECDNICVISQPSGGTESGYWMTNLDIGITLIATPE